MENKMGIDLVQSLREWLMANGEMNFRQAQEFAISFSSHYMCSDWVVFTNRNGEWKTFEPAAGIKA